MRQYLRLVPILFISLNCFSQNVGIGTNTPDISALLDLSSNNKGFLPPRMTTAQRDSIINPASGLQIFNSSTNCLQMYAYGIWQDVFCAKTPMDSLLRVGLVGYWPFNGNANDESGNGNNGTVNGATLTTDRNGVANTAYGFNGSNNFIDISYSSVISPVIGTVSAWVKTNSVLTDQSLIFGQGYGRPQLVVNNSKAYIAWLASPGSGANSGPSTTSVNIGNWVHILGIYTTNSFTIYINGNQENSSSTALNQYSCNAPFQIGGFNVSSFCGAGAYTGQFFNGQIDDIRIYNRALTQAEITYLATH